MSETYWVRVGGEDWAPRTLRECAHVASSEIGRMQKWYAGCDENEGAPCGGCAEFHDVGALERWHLGSLTDETLAAWIGAHWVAECGDAEIMTDAEFTFTYGEAVDR